MPLGELSLILQGAGRQRPAARGRRRQIIQLAKDGSCSEASVADRPEKSPARNSGQPQRSAGGMGPSLTTKRTLRVSSFLRKGTALFVLVEGNSSFLQKGTAPSRRQFGDTTGQDPTWQEMGKNLTDIRRRGVPGSTGQPRCRALPPAVETSLRDRQTISLHCNVSPCQL